MTQIRSLGFNLVKLYKFKVENGLFPIIFVHRENAPPARQISYSTKVYGAVYRLRQISYTDGAVVHRVVPCTAWSPAKKRWLRRTDRPNAGLVQLPRRAARSEFRGLFGCTFVFVYVFRFSGFSPTWNCILYELMKSEFRVVRSVAPRIISPFISLHISTTRVLFFSFGLVWNWWQANYEKIAGNCM
jgi:hypothetical protein